MNSTKPWYASKTVWAGLVATAIGVLGVVGITTPDGAQAELTTHLVNLATAIAGIVSIIGRVVAKQRIGADDKRAPLVWMLLLPALLITGCASLGQREQQNIREHAVNAAAFHDRVQSIDQPTPEQWQAVQRWVRSHAEFLRAMDIIVNGESVPPITEPDTETQGGPDDGGTATRRSIDRPDHQQPAGVAAGDSQRVRNRDPLNGPGRVLAAHGLDRTGQRHRSRKDAAFEAHARSDGRPQGGHHAHHAIARQRPAGAASVRTRRVPYGGRLRPEGGARIGGLTFRAHDMGAVSRPALAPGSDQPAL